MDLVGGIVAAAERLPDPGADRFLQEAIKSRRADAFLAALERSIERPSVAFQCCNALRSIFSAYPAPDPVECMRASVALLGSLCAHRPSKSSIPAMVDALTYLAIKSVPRVPDGPSQLLRAVGAGAHPLATVELLAVLPRLSRVSSRFISRKCQEASAVQIMPAWPAARAALQELYQQEPLRDRIIDAVCEWLKLGCKPTDPWIQSLVSSGSPDLVEAIMRTEIPPEAEAQLAEHICTLLFSSKDQEVRIRAAQSVRSLFLRNQSSTVLLQAVLRMLHDQDRDIGDEAVDAISIAAEDSEKPITHRIFPDCIRGFLIQATKSANYHRLCEDSKDRVDNSVYKSLRSMQFVSKECDAYAQVWSFLRGALEGLAPAAALPLPPPGEEQDEEDDRSAGPLMLEAVIEAVAVMAHEITTVRFKHPFFHRAPAPPSPSDEDTLAILRTLIQIPERCNARCDPARAISKLCIWSSKHPRIQPTIIERLMRTPTQSTKGLLRIAMFGTTENIDTHALQRLADGPHDDQTTADAVSCLAMIASQRGPDAVAATLQRLSSLKLMDAAVCGAGSKHPDSILPLIPAIIRTAASAIKTDPAFTSDSIRILRHAIRLCGTLSDPHIPHIISFAATECFSIDTDECISLLDECIRSCSETTADTLIHASFQILDATRGRSGSIGLIALCANKFKSKTKSHPSFIRAIHTAKQFIIDKQSDIWNDIDSLLIEAADDDFINLIFEPLIHWIFTPDTHYSDSDSDDENDGDASRRNTLIHIIKNFPTIRSAIIQSIIHQSKRLTSTLHDTLDDKLAEFIQSISFIDLDLSQPTSRFHEVFQVVQRSLST